MSQDIGFCGPGKSSGILNEAGDRRGTSIVRSMLTSHHPNQHPKEALEGFDWLRNVIRIWKSRQRTNHHREFSSIADIIIDLAGVGLRGIWIISL